MLARNLHKEFLHPFFQDAFSALYERDDVQVERLSVLEGREEHGGVPCVNLCFSHILPW